MNSLFPDKLKKGDLVRVISPSYTYKKISGDQEMIAKGRFRELGLKLSFGRHVGEEDDLESSSVQSRLEDLHEAFLDKDVKMVIASSGGYNSNFLLEKIDWKLIKNNPKIFVGMSDITVLSNAIYKMTGLVTYSGPNFRNFGQKKYFDYTPDYFIRSMMYGDPIEIKPADKWSDDHWQKDQNKRNLIKSDGWWPLSIGKAEGTSLGGNLCSFNLLQGTKYMPSINGSILMIEDDDISTVGEFSRNFQSLVHLDEFEKVRGIIFGRFQKKTEMKRELLEKIVCDVIGELKIPIIANVDFGHTDPKITFPIGGQIRIDTDKSELVIFRH